MAKMICLREYAGEEPQMLEVIKGFWIAHNDYTQTAAESLEDLRAWTAAGHIFFTALIWFGRKVSLSF